MARNNHGKNTLLDHERNANDKFFLFSSRTTKRPRRMDLSWPRQSQRRAKIRAHFATEGKARRQGQLFWKGFKLRRGKDKPGKYQMGAANPGKPRLFAV